MTPLADHKTLNYLFYLLAGKWAGKKGADEALIINPDGSVSETNTANIILIKEKNVILPVSSHVLPGVVQEKICKIMLKWGYKIEKQVLMVDDLFNCAEVFVSNSLMGAVPVISIDGKKTGQPSDLWLKINNSLTDNRSVLTNFTTQLNC
jgi:para-aminobenzoate synthetase component 1